MSGPVPEPFLPTDPVEAFDELSDIEERILARRKQGLEPPADAALLDRALRLRRLLPLIFRACRDDPEGYGLLCEVRSGLELLLSTLPEPGKNGPDA